MADKKTRKFPRTVRLAWDHYFDNPFLIEVSPGECLARGKQIAIYDLRQPKTPKRKKSRMR